MPFARRSVFCGLLLALTGVSYAQPDAAAQEQVQRQARQQGEQQKQLDRINQELKTLERDIKRAPADLRKRAEELKKQREALDKKVNQTPRCCGMDVRTIAGFEQSGAANAASNQSYFLDFFLSQPLPWTFARPGGNGSDQLGPRWRYFGEVRLTSVPQQVGSSLAEFVTGFSQLAGTIKPTELAQSAEYLAGIGYRLTSFGGPFGSGDGPKHRIAIYPMIMGGASGFLGSPPTPQIFEAPVAGDPQEALYKALFNNPPSSVAPTATNDGKAYIGFVEKDSSRYKKQYWGGFRVVSSYTDDAANRGSSRLDLLVGQNEAVTGGGFNGPVVRAEGFIPFDFGDSKVSNVLYFFGNVQLAINPPFDEYRLNTIRQTLGADRVFLKPALDVLASDTRVTIRNTNPLNRDFYRLGIGMDLLRLIRNYQATAGQNVATLEAIAGDKQKVVIGAKLRTGLRVQAFDASHKIVPAAKITWTAPDVEAGKPTCVFANGKTSYTDTAGASAIMEVTCTANSTDSADSYTVTAASNNNKYDFTITNVKLKTLAFTNGDMQDFEGGSALKIPLQVEAKDDAGPVAGIKVTFTVPTASATFDGGTTQKDQNVLTVTTDDKGIATGSALTPGMSATAFSVTADAGGAPQVKASFKAKTK